MENIESPSPAPAAAPAAPDTATIAANTLSNLEAEQSQSTPAPGSTPAPSSTPAAAGLTPAAAAKVQAEVSAELKWLQEQGHFSHKSDGRANWLPVATVERMLGKYLDSHKGDWTKERDGWHQERQSLAQAAQAAQQFRQMMQSDPRGLLQRMAQLDPRYGEFLQQPQREQLPPEESDPEPEPDLDLGNGRRTYSLDGIRKMREWERRNMERAFDQRMAPFAERVRQEEQRKHEERIETMLRTRTQNVLTRAKTWPKWAENEGEILKVLQADSAEAQRAGTEPQLSVHDAYMQVVTPVLSGDYNTIREQVMRELNGAPRSTAVGQTGAEPVRRPGPITVEDIARRAMARLEGGR